MTNSRGFTLIELSIVLVIIGLVIGGILVGRQLISAANERALIAQIEQYKTAVYAFRIKYNYLPGDLPASQASSVGMQSRMGTVGSGDGNGRVETDPNLGTIGSGQVYVGEPVMFWTDLSDAGMVEGKFSQSGTADVKCQPAIGCNSFYLYFPRSRMDSRVYISALDNYDPVDGIPNYYGVVFQTAHVERINSRGQVVTLPSMNVAQAYSIDTKIDDGKPIAGLVVSARPGIVATTDQFLGQNTDAGVVQASTTSGYCVSGASPRVYNLTFSDDLGCSLMFGTKF